MDDLEIRNVSDDSLITTLNCFSAYIRNKSEKFAKSGDVIAYLSDTNSLNLYNMNTGVNTKIVELEDVLYQVNKLNALEVFIIDNNFVFVNFVTLPYHLGSSTYRTQSYCGVYDISKSTYSVIGNKVYTRSTNGIGNVSAICNLENKIYISLEYGDTESTAMKFDIFMLDKSTSEITSVKTGNTVGCHGGTQLTRSFEGFEDNNYIYFPSDSSYSGIYKRFDKQFNTASTISIVSLLTNEEVTSTKEESIFKYDGQYYIEATVNGVNAICLLTVLTTDTLSFSVTPMIYIPDNRLYDGSNYTNYEFSYEDFYDNYVGKLFDKISNVITFIQLYRESLDGVTYFLGITYKAFLYDIAEFNTDKSILNTSKSTYNMYVVTGTNNEEDISL